MESPSGPGTCYADQADFELTENCLPLRAVIQVCDPMPERPPVLPVPSSHLQTHLLHRTCHDHARPCVPLFSIPPPSLRCPLYRSQLAPVHSSWCVSFPMAQGHRLVHASAGPLMPEAPRPCLLPSVCPQVLRLVPRCGSSSGRGGLW